MTEIEALETPVPLVDLDRLERNLDRMAAVTRQAGLALRPHAKTHKALPIARMQMARGAVGLTCATLREMEVMAEVAGDLLLAHPPVHPAKLDRLFDLPEPVRLSVAVDSAEAVTMLARAAQARGRPLDVLVELDLGMHRVGVAEGADALDLARQVEDATALAFAGVLFYPGHIKRPAPDQGPAITRLVEALGAVCVRLADGGLPPRVVSGGSTPTATRFVELRHVTEVRPGTYVYNDRITVATGAASLAECALTVLATVVSTAVPGQAVVDAGSKALGREPFDGLEGFGALLDRPEVTVRGMSEEHGILDLSRTDWRPRVGDRVRIVPNHVCIVVHLNDQMIGVRGEVVETGWEVAARGRGFHGVTQSS